MRRKKKVRHIDHVSKYTGYIGGDRRRGTTVPLYSYTAYGCVYSIMV